jgi:Phage integrase family.
VILNNQVPKKRIILLEPKTVRLYQKLQKKNVMDGESDIEKIFNCGQWACNNMLQMVYNNSDLPAYHCHEFRHSFISNLISKEVPPPVISKVSGDA